jgi:hypothetical protein
MTEVRQELGGWWREHRVDEAAERYGEEALRYIMSK